VDLAAYVYPEGEWLMTTASSVGED
jgi:hypothetical protein